MPSFYCIKYGLVCAGLIMVGIVAMGTLIYALFEVGEKHHGEIPAKQNR